MKEKLLNPKIISETHDPEGREEILDSTSSLESELLIIKEKIPLHEAKKIELAKKLSVLEKEAENTVSILADRLKTLIVKIKIRLGLNDEVVTNLEGMKQIIDIEKESLLQELSQIEIEIENLKNKLNELPNPQELLDAYHEKMLDTPLTNEEKREFLKPEILASLTTEEYVQLWRRLNPHYLSHVTRQGLRDHNAMIYHSAGMNEFHDGFVGVMQDEQKIRTPMALEGLLPRDEESIRGYLEKNGILKAENEEEAISKLKDLLDFTIASAPKYPDESAVHFAAQIVADEYYGGEKNNEVFFLYPADVIASQHAFAFNGRDQALTRPQNETKWNDVFVWPTSIEERGISVDAGFVFLPNRTLVDPETGSRYASEVKTVNGKEKRVVVEDQETPKAFTKWISGMNEQPPIVVAFKKWRETHDWQQQDKCREEFHQLLLKDLKRIGFNDGVIPELMIYLLNKFGWTKEDCLLGEDVIPEVIEAYSGGKKRAENLITAKEYWEKYFEQHPDQKPKHIIFYDGDPTRAVQEFQQKNKIGRADTSVTDGDLLGFDDNLVRNMKEDPRANQGYTELYEIAKKIIDEHYN